MILVTGAAGKTGQAVIRALATSGEPVRALVRRSRQTQRVLDLGVQEAVAGDMRLPEAMSQATRGVRAIYHICPNMSSDEVSIGQSVIAAARSADVERLVYHSVLHPQTEAMPHHWLKLRVEEQLFESGLAYTILQPAVYMQNVLAHWEQIVEQGIYRVPYAAETRLAVVDLEDVAAAAAIVLTAPGHLGATYELASHDVPSQIDIAAILTEQLCRPVRAQAMPLATWEREARASGLGDYQVETLVKMFRYYEKHGLLGNAQVLSWLLGRPPTTFTAFVRSISQERVGA